MRKPRILVVDDNAVLRKKLSAILRKRYAVRTAEDGAEALRVCHRDPPDLLVADINMPCMNGWDLVRTLRAHPRLGLLPVVFLTTENSSAALLRGFRLGADDYLDKPVSGRELLTRVEQVLRKRNLLLLSFREGLGNEPALQGSLEQLGLSSLLSLVGQGQETGTISMLRYAAEGLEEAGRVSIRDGQAIRASLRDRPELHSRLVTFYLLSWGSGRFRFTPGEVEGDDEIQLSSNMLLMEGARQIDEICNRCGAAGTDELRRQFTGRRSA